LNCSNLLVEIHGQDRTNQYTKDYGSFQFKQIKGAGISITSVFPTLSPKDGAEKYKKEKSEQG
jgi:hypothetical protein